MKTQKSEITFTKIKMPKTIDSKNFYDINQRVNK